MLRCDIALNIKEHMDASIFMKTLYFLTLNIFMFQQKLCVIYALINIALYNFANLFNSFIVIML